jgi:outer membrane receptor protein involved in Fe transport
MQKIPGFLLLQVVFLVLPVFGFTQTKRKLTGTVSDSTKPMPLVTVRLFKHNNTTTPLQTTLTAENGSYQLNKPDTGNYVLAFNHTGFAGKTVTINVNTSEGDMQVDPVQLSRSAGLLKEVVVKSQRPMVEQSDDKIVYNVEDDPSSKSETAIDILRKTPFVTVDGEDNIKINGKSNFKVLLNGRETSMFARNIKEALRGFPGALISKIEVITSPSAKYDGEGIGGLINIITKKKVAGYNGTLTSFSRTSDKTYAFSVNGNAKIGKVGLSVFYNYGLQDPVSQRNISTTIPIASTAYTKRVLDGDQRNSATWSYGNAELSYEIDSLNTLSVYSNIDSWSSRTLSSQTITTDFVAAPSTVSFYNLTNKSNNPGVNVGGDYIRHFKRNKEREFSLRFLGEFGKSDSKLNSFQDNPGIDRYLENISYARNNQYTIQADNIIPVSKTGRIEGGVKAILRRANSDFRSQIKYNETDDYKTNNSNTDYFNYEQDVLSVYTMYTLRVKKSTFRIGGRVEHTNVDGNFVTSKTEVKNDYTTFLPNVQWTNRVTPITTLVFGYTKRLQRPYIYDLNPFINNNDSLNISYGNPELGPQTSHVLSGQVRFGKGNTFAGINVEGSYSGNKILQYTSFDPATGISKTTSLNIGKELQSSVNINFNTKFTPNWSFFVNGSIRYLSVKNNSDKTQSNTGLGCNLSINTNYRFTDRFNISSFLGLWKDPQTIQTTYPFSTWHNVAFNYKVFNNKVNISLRGVNYYDKIRRYETITKDKNFYSSNLTRQYRRALALALTWNFGKLNENVSKKKGVSNDDILSRPAAPAGN